MTQLRRIARSISNKFTMLNAFTKFYKIKKKQQHEIILTTFSPSMIISEPAVETWSQKINGGPGNGLGARTGELNSSPTLEIIL